MTNQYKPLTEEQIAALTDWDRQWLPMIQKHHPVNVRVLDGVDLGSLPEPQRSDAAKWPPVYTNP